MIISYQWLLEYLPEPLPVNELSQILTSIGLEVEAVEPVETIKGGLEGLVTGEVLTCAKHPNADKLSVTTVSVGGAEPLHIVCGAPNVAAGQKVIVATVGTTVYPTEGDPITIKKAKIRGEESAGMICAEDEIGLGNSHAGIMILPADTQVGIPASQYFNLPATDHAIHIGLTPNRSDANSHIGVARDVCAYLSHHRKSEHRAVMPVSFFDIDDKSGTDGWPAINVSIEAVEACPRYAGMGISGVKVGDSPEWLQRRLAAIGVRSINNIVDITNYVLHEYGQPLHAFDADRLNGGKIVVRHLPEGTVFTGLDDKQRKLRADDLMICDGNGPVAIGGVFGGKDSGITEGTANVFLESAYFAPMGIRRTSMHHGLRTDAATHFEKGVDINNVLPALHRAAAMIAEIAGGRVLPHMTDVYPTPLKTTEVSITYEHIRRLSGKDYGHEAIRNILLALGFGIQGETAEMLKLSVPSNKTDVTQPADIVEEILRIDGLDNIEIPQRLNISLTKALPTDRHMRERVAALLCGMGMQEIVTNSIVNSKYYPGNETLVRMINSLSADLDCMRPSLLEGALEVAAYNCNRRSTDLALFEFGNVYKHIDGKYVEESRLSLLVTGNARGQHWQYKAQPADIYYLKGLLNNMLAANGITGIATSYDGDTIVWKWKNRELCRMMQVPKDKRTAFDVKQDVYYAEIYWEVWYSATGSVKTRYSEVPKFPAVQRDLAIVLDTQVSYQQVQEVTAQLKLAELRTYGLFDVFESEKLGAGKKSYALNYTFQLQDRTLTDAETEQLMKKLADAYKNKLNALIRD
ncbi:phenylalanine--tRNA ligase subunit beta [Nemorincola caseinilytica]|uniref:Phenylalanine--tRNA ligase beta subunit n=1 Tax=Nemorincola caseinilytica TaxID=2054315 RepID=A0ABP8N6S7_9BACT